MIHPYSPLNVFLDLLDNFIWFFFLVVAVVFCFSFFDVYVHFFSSLSPFHNNNDPPMLTTFRNQHCGTEHKFVSLFLFVSFAAYSSVLFSHRFGYIFLCSYLRRYIRVSGPVFSRGLHVSLHRISGIQGKTEKRNTQTIA